MRFGGLFEHIVHPISVARKGMEETPHVMLVGKGALQFAEQQGFLNVKTCSPRLEKAWRKWLEDSGTPGDQCGKSRHHWYVGLR